MRPTAWPGTPARPAATSPRVSRSAWPALPHRRPGHAARQTASPPSSPVVACPPASSSGSLPLSRSARWSSGPRSSRRSRPPSTVKTQLRQRLYTHLVRLGPGWLVDQRTGEVTTLATRGLDALDGYFARYLPQMVLAGLIPTVVLIRIGPADWIAAATIAITLPLIPVFMALVGWTTRTGPPPVRRPRPAVPPLPRRRRRTANPQGVQPRHRADRVDP